MEETKTTLAEGTEPGGEVEKANPEEKTFTQAEVDGIVQGRLAREKKSLPSDGELASFREWRESQKTAAERQQEEIGKANKERDDALAEKMNLERSIDLLAAGIPKDKMAQYARLVESYMSDDVTFSKAVEATLKDFPVKPAGVPGVSGNPAPVEKERKGRPSGTVIF